MKSITPVLLAGGSGTRLWPLSRKSYPKQFSQIIGNISLFQDSALRLTSSKKIKFGPHITLTHSDFRFIVSQQLSAVGVNSGSILIEPISKNTAPAILTASLHAFKKDPEATLLVCPSDHVIPNKNQFHEAVKDGYKETLNGKIVTFGIQPSYPETGYGYLELEKGSKRSKPKFVSFVEKPNKIKVKEMLASGNYLWNAGIFLFNVKDMISAFNKHAPDILSATQKSLENAKLDLDFIRLETKAWSLCENISIDYAILEKIKNLSIVKFSENWTDLGSWQAVWKKMNPDKNGVSLSQNSHALDCKNTLLRSENKSQEVVGLGLENIIAIAMPDAVLVANKDKDQDIRKIVANLKAKNISQAEIFPKDHRPWGWFESLVKSDFFQVKKIFVKPGAAISLQSHNYRSEHWVIVEGKAKVTINDKVELIVKGQSIYVPLGTIHRLENPGKLPVIFIEIQIGNYLGEDDIIRYEDFYSRS